MEEYNHFAYGLQMATRLKAVKHTDQDRRWYECAESDNLISLMQRLSSVTGTVMIGLDGKNSDFGYNDAESLRKKPQYFFMILTTARADDSAAILAGQEMCEGIALQIQARMMLDSRNYDNGLTGFIPESVTIRGIGPMGDNLFGVIMGFNEEHGVDYQIKDEYWT